MVGTLYNAIAVAVGASIGLLVGRKIPASFQESAFVALGLFTLGMGVLMCQSMAEPFAVFMALVLGAMLGNGAGLDRRLTKVADRFGSGTGAALVQSVILFCAGAMTLIGCMTDGMEGDPTILLAKGTMDFVSASFLAAALGSGVLLAAPAVLVIQGGLTLGFQWLGEGMAQGLIDDLTGLGGILLLALGLDLLRIRRLELLNLLPSFLLLPALRPFAIWLTETLPLLMTS